MTVNGTVRDLQTGLMWSRDAALTDFPLSWPEAFDYIHGLNSQNFKSHSDWRLPNRRELFSLISHKQINPALPTGHPFVNVFPGYYWTATACARLPAQAWYIHLGGARVYRGMKHASCMVWPVRMESTRAMLSNISPRPRFSAEDRTVTDRLTGLVWTRSADPEKTPVNWEQAASIIRRMNAEGAFGFTDWRLPHIREFDHLVDLGTHSPALPIDHPFTNVRDHYWSATTSQYETRYAWTLYLQDGALGVGFKENAEFYLWPVWGEREGSKFKVQGSGLKAEEGE